MASEQTQEAVDASFETVRQAFRAEKTAPLAFRIQQLRLLRESLLRHQAQIVEAAHEDLHNSAYEVELSVFFPLLPEIDLAIKNLEQWSAPRKLETPILLFPSNVTEQLEPLGTSLIIGAWNYPFSTLLLPFVNAVAAGNTAVLKPSEFAWKCALVIEKIVSVMDQSCYRCLLGGVATSRLLNAKPFDLIVFTGGTAVGKLIAAEAAKNLSKVLLELGGKNPTVIDASCNMPLTVQRLVHGKFFNCGQTCVTADYVFVHKSISAPFQQAVFAKIQELFGRDAATSPAYGRIITSNHARRIAKYLEGFEKHIVF